MPPRAAFLRARLSLPGLALGLLLVPGCSPEPVVEDTSASAGPLGPKKIVDTPEPKKGQLPMDPQ